MIALLIDIKILLVYTDGIFFCNVFKVVIARNEAISELCIGDNVLCRACFVSYNNDARVEFWL